MGSFRLKWKSRWLLAGIAGALTLAFTYTPQPAHGATIEERIVKLERQNQAQARRIHTLERVNAEQNAKLGWFKECTPAALDIGLFVDEAVGDRFNLIAQTIPDPGIAWVPLAYPIGANTFALQLHQSCIKGATSGFPW
jgi:hypothetical protein